MAYFSKDAYARKREYAYKVSLDSLEILAIALLADNPKYADLDREDPEKLDSLVEDLIEELRPIANLSHKRHEIHSTDRSHFFSDVSELVTVGNEYSDGCLIDDVNSLNRKYNLVDTDVPIIGDVVVTSDDSTEDILDYYGKDSSGDESTDHDLCYSLMYDDWDSVINTWSDNVRSWFKKLNEKFGTDFPD